MRILYAISLVCFCVLVGAIIAIRRHIQAAAPARSTPIEPAAPKASSSGSTNRQSS